MGLHLKLNHCHCKQQVKMPKACCIYSCTSNKTKNPDLKFYVLPVASERRTRWLQAIGRAQVTEEGAVNTGVTWSPKGSYIYVCSKHFITGSKSNDKDHPDYVPSVFPARNTTSGDLGSEKMARFIRSKVRSDTKARKRLYEEVDSDVENVNPLEQAFMESPREAEQERPCPMSAAAPEESEVSRLKSQVQTLTFERDQALREVDRLRKIVHGTGLRYELVIDDDSRCQMMTGLTWLVFSHLFTFLRKSLGTGSTRHSLPLKDQLFVTLVKLRHNPSFDFLSVVTGVPKSTCIDYFWKWVTILHDRCGYLVKWQDREHAMSIIPPVFKEKFPRLTSIIDCFELFIDAPKDLMARAQCYSNYKKHTTVKVFISCNPVGQINFISKAWGGRVSDIQVVRESGFISNMYHMPGDQILADRGFTLVEDFAAVCSAELIIPAFTKGKSQLSAREVENSRKISSVRIHIERVIGLMKNRFAILQGTLPIRAIKKLQGEASESEMCSIDVVVKACAVLVNLEESIVFRN